MKDWTVILAGVLLAALPNLGNSALEDAGVVMSNDYTEFEKRVIPPKTSWICTLALDEYEWFQINKFEQLLLDFENGNNSLKAIFRLGTPAILMAMPANNEFVSASYCKYLPKAFHSENWLRNEKASIVTLNQQWEYYAVKIKDTERATILQGWNYLLNLLKNSPPDNKPISYGCMIVEKTAAGVIYVGPMQDNM